MANLKLPSYLAQSETVKARFDDLKRRDVILEVSELGKTFESVNGPVTALEGVNFRVHRREFVTVIGPSGCGKSTLLRMVAGLEDITSGEISIGDRVSVVDLSGHALIVEKV